MISLLLLTLFIDPSFAATCGGSTPTPSLSVASITKTVSGQSVEYRRITTNGCPPYDWTSQKTPNKAETLNLNLLIPVKPVFNTGFVYVGLKDNSGNLFTSSSQTTMGAIGRL